MKVLSILVEDNKVEIKISVQLEYTTKYIILPKPLNHIELAAAFETLSMAIEFL